MLCSHTSYSKPNSSYNSYAPSSTLPPLETSSSNPPEAPHSETITTINAFLPPYHSLIHDDWGVSPLDTPPAGNGEPSSEKLISVQTSWTPMDDKGKGKEEQPSRSSPSASSSQGDMADTELEAGSSQPTEQGESAPPPPKKKRTRTLTTPHQSAVLHALLAQVWFNLVSICICLIVDFVQSRFPTTAMREEVGRSIGLSARKVQVRFFVY